MSRRLHRSVYRLCIGIYFGAIRTISPFHAKAKAMVEGRKHVLDTIKAKRKPDEQWVMIHTSSVGEFEQARPIIEWLRKEHPQLKICLTFFSPSGYNAYKNYPLADIVTYLPFDNSKDLQTFIDLLEPKFALIIKYEFWLHMIDILHTKGVPIYLISAIFREDQPFFHKSYGRIFVNGLRKFKTLFIQNENSARLLDSIGLTNYIISGDTRMDRVVQVKEKGAELEELVRLRQVAQEMDKRILVAGSTWEPDERILLKYAEKHPDVLLILVPHEIPDEHIRQIMNRTSIHTTRFTEWDGKSPEQVQLLIIDKIGLLSTIYKYADIAYIGGGFGKGIHNTLEAAVYGIPIIIGPKNQKFQEAQTLIQNGACYSIANYDELEAKIDTLLGNPTLLNESGKAAQEVVHSHLGATKIVTDTLSQQEFK